MKKIKPGQFYSYNGHIVRAAKATLACKGCIYFNNMICPDTVLKGSKRQPADCGTNGIIFVKP